MTWSCVCQDFEPGTDVTAGDVVRRDNKYKSGALRLQIDWDLLFERLDPFVNNSIHPVIVLDNVPWAFAPPGVNTSAATYGQNMGPQNVTE